MKKSFSTRIKIEKEEKILSNENLWVTTYCFWKELWASVVMKELSSSKVTYLFKIKWKGVFPKNFRVIISDRIFLPTQTPEIDIVNDTILFHAKSS